MVESNNSGLRPSLLVIFPIPKVCGKSTNKHELYDKIQSIIMNNIFTVRKTCIFCDTNLISILG